MTFPGRRLTTFLCWIFLVSFFVTSSTKVSRPNGCYDSSWTYYYPSHSCFKLVPDEKLWSEAEQQCVCFNKHWMFLSCDKGWLARIQDKPTNDFIKDLLPSHDVKAHIGLYKDNYKSMKWDGMDSTDYGDDEFLDFDDKVRQAEMFKTAISKKGWEKMKSVTKLPFICQQEATNDPMTIECPRPMRAASDETFSVECGFDFSNWTTMYWHRYETKMATCHEKSRKCTSHFSTIQTYLVDDGGWKSVLRSSSSRANAFRNETDWTCTFMKEDLVLGSKSCDIIVYEPSEVISFMPSQQDVDEDQEVTLTCLAGGNPGPAISILTSNPEAKHVQLLNSTSPNNRVSKTFNAQCLMMGSYECISRNELNGRVHESRMSTLLRIKCPPTSCEGEGHVQMFVVKLSGQGEVTLCALGFPIPNTQNFKLYTDDTSDKERRNYDISLKTTDQMLTGINVKFTDLTPDDMTQHTLYYPGDQHVAHSYIKFNLTAEETNDTATVVPIVLGSVATLLVVAIIVLIILCFCRKETNDTATVVPIVLGSVATLLVVAIIVLIILCFCRKGFTHKSTSSDNISSHRESRRPVQLPLFEGDDSVPLDAYEDVDNDGYMCRARVISQKTDVSNPTETSHNVEVGITPATQEQNYSYENEPPRGSDEADYSAAESMAENKKIDQAEVESTQKQNAYDSLEDSQYETPGRKFKRKVESADTNNFYDSPEDNPYETPVKREVESADTNNFYDTPEDNPYETPVKRKVESADTNTFYDTPEDNPYETPDMGEMESTDTQTISGSPEDNPYLTPV